ARIVDPDRRELAAQHVGDVRDVLPEARLSLAGQVAEMLVVVLQEQDAVAAIHLLVGERHVRLRQARDEVGVRTVRDAGDPVAGGAAHARYLGRARSARNLTRTRRIAYGPRMPNPCLRSATALIAALRGGEIGARELLERY